MKKKCIFKNISIWRIYMKIKTMSKPIVDEKIQNNEQAFNYRRLSNISECKPFNHLPKN